MWVCGAFGVLVHTGQESLVSEAVQDAGLEECRCTHKKVSWAVRKGKEVGEVAGAPSRAITPAGTRRSRSRDGDMMR